MGGCDANDCSYQLNVITNCRAASLYTSSSHAEASTKVQDVPTLGALDPSVMIFSKHNYYLYYLTNLL